MKLSKHQEDKTLREWREQNRHQINDILTMAKEIRDASTSVHVKCPYCQKEFDKENAIRLYAARDRLEAGKLIARLLHALQVEKGESAPKLPTAGKAALDKGHQERLDALLAQLK